MASVDNASIPEQRKSTRTYKGNCHCQAHVFTVELPEPGIQSIIICNCSICKVKDLLWLDVPQDAVSFVRPPFNEENKEDSPLPSLAQYEFFDRTQTHEFCRTCGNQLWSKPKKDRPEAPISINIRLIQELEPWAVPVSKDVLDAASRPPAYQQPKYSGPGFTEVAPKQGSSVEGEPADEDSIVPGSCHCGKVTYLLKVRHPKGGSLFSKGDLNECNCSSCWRHALVNCYPRDGANVLIEGKDSLTMYEKPVVHYGLFFCKNCGVSLFVAAPAPLKEDGERDLTSLSVGALNIRTLHGVDVEELGDVVNRYDGRANAPAYLVG